MNQSTASAIHCIKPGLPANAKATEYGE